MQVNTPHTQAGKEDSAVIEGRPVALISAVTSVPALQSPRAVLMDELTQQGKVTGTAGVHVQGQKRHYSLNVVLILSAAHSLGDTSVGVAWQGTQSREGLWTGFEA